MKGSSEEPGSSQTASRAAQIPVLHLSPAELGSLLTLSPLLLNGDNPPHQIVGKMK